MRQMLLATLVCCSLASSAQAAGVMFLGTISSKIDIGGTGGPFSIGQEVYFNPNWVPVAGIANLSHAFFIVGSETWNQVNAASTATISNNGVRDQLTINSTGFSDLSGSGYSIGTIAMTLTSNTNNGLSGATEGNLNTILNATTLVPGSVSGQFVVSNGANTSVYSFTGAAVPEPASAAMLGGLGLVFAANAWRRRKKNSELSA